MPSRYGPPAAGVVPKDVDTDLHDRLGLHKGHVHAGGRASPDDGVSRLTKALRQHMELFPPVPGTMAQGDPRPADTPVEAKHRRPRTYNLLVTRREYGSLPESPATMPCATSTPPSDWRPASRSCPWPDGSATPTPGSRFGSTRTSCSARKHEAAPPSTRSSRSPDDRRKPVQGQSPREVPEKSQ